MKKRHGKKLIVTALTATVGFTTVFAAPFTANAKEKKAENTSTYSYVNKDLRYILQPTVKIPECVNVKKVLVTETATPYTMLYLYDFNSTNKYDTYTSIMGLYDYLKEWKSDINASETITKTVAKTTADKSTSKTKKRKIVLKETADNSTTKLDSNGLIPIKVGNTVFVDYGKYEPMCAYMGYHLITAVSSQLTWKQSHDWSYDSEGFAVYKGRYIIACTTTFGDVGDYVDFYLENGLIIPCIIGDIKGETTTDGTPASMETTGNEWCVYGHIINNYLNVIEFCVSPSWYSGLGHVNPGTSTCHPEFGYKVLYAVCGGDVDTSVNYEKQTTKESVIEENTNEESTENVVYPTTEGTTESSKETSETTVVQPTEKTTTQEQTQKETEQTTESAETEDTGSETEEEISAE